MKPACIISYIYPTEKYKVSGIFVKRQVEYIKKDLDVTLIKGNGNNGIIFILNCMKRLINKDFYVVHQHFVGISTIIIGIICKLRHIPFILTSHGTSWELSRNIFKRLLIRLIFAFPNKIICVSEKTKARLLPNTRKNKLVIINNGFEMPEPTKTREKFKKVLNMKDKYIMLSVSNIVEKKGIDIIIRSIPKIREIFPNLIYLIVGDGRERKNLEELTEKLGLNDCVIFAGVKLNEELSNYYNASDIFALMSVEEEDIIESFGIVYLEASYFKLPVLGRNVYDAIENEKSGFLVSDEDTLKIKVCELLKNRKLRNDIGSYGRQRVIDKFMLKDKVAEILDLYKACQTRKTLRVLQ